MKTKEQLESELVPLKEGSPPRGNETNESDAPKPDREVDAPRFVMMKGSATDDVDLDSLIGATEIMPDQDLQPEQHVPDTQPEPAAQDLKPDRNVVAPAPELLTEGSDPSKLRQK